ncbi:MAG: hypothetical protein AB1761_07000 [Pseudomonadota bacterium]
MQPRDLAQQTLITYPAQPRRVDVFAPLLLPVGMASPALKSIESTVILPQMLAAGRGVTAPRLGRSGTAKQIHVGVRAADYDVRGFVELARVGATASGAWACKRTGTIRRA